jgi:DNA-binding MarR family transcriptional regulator
MDTGTTVDAIVENLFYAIPVIHKKLMRIDPPELNCGIRISRLHIGILAMLSENTNSISDIANTFFIPKPQMTYLIDRMVEAGLVKRTASAHDRRVTNVELTAKGKEIFTLCDQHLKRNVRSMLSSLTEGELREFSESLIKLKEIGPRLDRTGY